MGLIEQFFSGYYSVKKIRMTRQISPEIETNGYCKLSIRYGHESQNKARCYINPIIIPKLVSEKKGDLYEHLITWGI